MRDDLLRLAKRYPNSPLRTRRTDEVTLADGRLVSTGDAYARGSIADAMRHGAVDRMEQEKTTTSDRRKTHAHNAHSAIFVEVKVDEQLGIIRVTRVVSAVAAGRILNAKTADSQIMGSVVWGIGMALHEETLIDHRFGRIMNANIAEYHVPVNADVHDIKVIFVDEPDRQQSPRRQGLGEIGIVGVAAAIANAVYHATGKRMRDLPITLDKLAALTPMAGRRLKDLSPGERDLFADAGEGSAPASEFPAAPMVISRKKSLLGARSGPNVASLPARLLRASS